MCIRDRSRERYWGTPLPVWRSEDGEVVRVIGSFAELEELSGVSLEDPHRPYVDDVVAIDPETGTTSTMPDRQAVVYSPRLQSAGPRLPVPIVPSRSASSV